MSFVNIKGTKFVRDTKSMGLTNTDRSGLEDYKLKRKLLQTQKEEINTIKTDVLNIKDDMKDIKTLLYKLLENK